MSMSVTAGSRAAFTTWQQLREEELDALIDMPDERNVSGGRASMPGQQRMRPRKPVAGARPAARGCRRAPAPPALRPRRCQLEPLQQDGRQRIAARVAVGSSVATCTLVRDPPAACAPGTATSGPMPCSCRSALRRARAPECAGARQTRCVPRSAGSAKRSAGMRAASWSPSGSAGCAGARLGTGAPAAAAAYAPRNRRRAPPRRREQR